MLARPPALVSLVLMGPLLFSGPLVAGELHSVEVFTAADFPISGKDDSRLRATAATIYAVDGLAQFEAALSRDLPTDTHAAKTEALRRIGALNEARMAPAKEAAMGLTKAVQYGVDRYPAIVIDGVAVIYGVTDLAEAIHRYNAWRETESP